MSHERSETIQGPHGSWINVYGRGTSKAGKQLPDSSNYRTVDAAVKAAKQRSHDHGMALSGPGGVLPEDNSVFAFGGEKDGK